MSQDLAPLAGRLADLGDRPLDDHPGVIDEVLEAIAAELDELARAVQAR